MPRILFGRRPDWRRRIERHIDKGQFRYAFAGPRDLDPGACDCVVPLTFDDYLALAAWPELQGQKFLIPDPALVALCDDKLAFNRHILAGPFAHLIPPLADGADPALPTILKRRRSEFGRDTVIISGASNDPAIAMRLADPEYFRQVLLAGEEEFALHLLVVAGKVVFHRTVRHRMAGPLTVKGASARPVASEMLPDSAHLADFAPLMPLLGYTGTCCIDYKLASGRPMLMELNPRLGITLLNDINGYLEALLGVLVGRPPKREPVWKQLWNRSAHAVDRAKARKPRA
ncbi:MAG: hypothetical protein ABI399_05805 [Bauldia sp.]